MTLWLVQLIVRFFPNFTAAVVQAQKAQQDRAQWNFASSMVGLGVLSEEFDYGFFLSERPNQDRPVKWRFGYIRLPGEELCPVVYGENQTHWPTDGWTFERPRMAPDARSGTLLRCTVQAGKWAYL